MILLRNSRWRGDDLLTSPEWADEQSSSLRKWNWLEHERRLNPKEASAPRRRLRKQFYFRGLTRE